MRLNTIQLNLQIALPTEERCLIIHCPGYLNKMLHFSLFYLFFSQQTVTKNAHEPLQLLGSLPITTAHQMLHKCNIFKEDFHET